MKEPKTGGAGRVLGWVLGVAGVLVALGFMFLAERPELASAHGAIVDRVLDFLLIVVGIFVVAGHVLLGRWILRSRAAGNAPPEAPASLKNEKKVAWIVVLVMALVSETGVIVLGLPAWEEMYGPPPAGTLEVEMVGKQFGWVAHYPGKDGVFGKTNPRFVNDADNPIGLDENDDAAADDVVLDGVLHVPADRPVLVRLRSHDVLHSFSVPNLRVKQDLVPGMTSKVQFRPTRSGTYEIACAEICGLGHYRMRGVLTVEPEEAFVAWLAKQDTFQ